MNIFRLTILLLLSGASVVVGAPEPECILNLDEVPAKGSTKIWSPLFAASWGKLNAMQDGEIEKIVPPNHLISKLEEFQWQEHEVMPKDVYAVYAGPATQQFINETSHSIKKRFGIKVNPIRVPINPQGRISYGILLSELKFRTPFIRSRSKALDFLSGTGETSSVDFFGTAGSQSKNYRNHVKVLHYSPDSSSFSLSIATDKKDERLILYLPNKECSFRSAIAHIKNAIETPLSGSYGSLQDGALHQKDVLKIPYLTTIANTDFTEQLSGLIHYSGETFPWYVSKAFQMTKLELFEGGVRVRVQTDLGLDAFGAPPEPPSITPRNFVYDRPFYVFIWRNGAQWPYLAAWIDGSHCLTPFSK